MGKPPARGPVLDLSLTQIIGGSLAAGTAAALSSSLGVAGTVVGTALFSVIAAVAGAVYTQSLRHTRERVRTGGAATFSGRRRATPPAASAAAARTARLRPRRLLAGAIAVFVLAFAGITAYELLTGGPLSGGTGGTTLNEVTGTGSGGVDVAPRQDVPAGTPTADPTQIRTEPSATTAPSSSTPTPASTTPASPTPGSTTPASTTPASTPGGGTTTPPAGSTTQTTQTTSPAPPTTP